MQTHPYIVLEIPAHPVTDESNECWVVGEYDAFSADDAVIKATFDQGNPNEGCQFIAYRREA